MIPMVDDFIQMLIAEKLYWLKQHPKVINHIFRCGRRETLDKLQNFITNNKVRVIIGYPKEQSSLPAYVITLAPEAEQPIGLGDDAGFYEGYDPEGIGDDAEDYLKLANEHIDNFIAGTFMNSNYRIECWSDNGDLTAYMYIILKWCLWGSRQQMLDLGWVNIKLSGTDLEPVPDYFPIFIYRRAAQLSLTYENLYYENLSELDKYIDVIINPGDYTGDEDGNVIDKDGNIIIPGKYNWIIKSHYYLSESGDETSSREYHIPEEGEIDLKILVVDKLPDIGKPQVIYFVKKKDEDGTVLDNEYEQWWWVDGKFRPFGNTKLNVDLSEYDKIKSVNQKDEQVLQAAKEYHEENPCTPEEIGLEEIGAAGVNDLFNTVFKL